MNAHQPATPAESRSATWVTPMARHSQTLNWIALYLAIATLVLNFALLLGTGTSLASVTWLPPLAHASLVGFIVSGISALLLLKLPPPSGETDPFE